MSNSPDSFPLVTPNYAGYFKTLQSVEFLKDLLESNWDISDYTGVGDPANIASFNLLDGFTLKSAKLTWFTYPMQPKWLSLISDIKKSMITNNNASVDIDRIGTAFLILVPGAHLQEHIDRGEFGGTSLIFPILGKGEFTYNNNQNRFVIDNPTFASNTVWHNFLNSINSLTIIMTLALPINITELTESNLQLARETK